MRQVLTALVTAGIITLITASTADAQWGGWRGGWHAGGDYYSPSDYGYGSAPLYGYGSVPAYGSGAVVEPMQTIQTIETVQTIRPATRSTVHRDIVTRRTTIRSFAANTYSQPLYNYAGSAAVVSAPAYNNTTYQDYGTNYAHPLYDTAAPSAAVVAPVTSAIISPPAYRYVYQWDRILVIDPATNIAVQAIPR